MQMPKDFASAPYEAVSLRVSGKNQTHLDSLVQFAAAWNAVRHRFLSCTEHSEAFTKAIKEAGTPGVTPQTADMWHAQQKELFDFFMNGLATIENVCYGLFAVGSILDAQQFPIVTENNLRDINTKLTACKFVAVFPNEVVTSALQQLITSQEFKDWRDIRRVLFHRGLPGRIISLTLGGGEPLYGGTQWGQGVWGQGIPIDEHTTVSRRRWLVETLQDLLNAADAFTCHHL